MYVNILQAQRHREIAFFTNSLIAMDLQRLKETMEHKIAPIKVGLMCEDVHREKQTEGFNTSSNQISAIHVELDLTNFQHNFKVVMETHRMSVSGFDDCTKMRLLVHPDLVKSDTAKGKLIKSCERQKCS